MYLFPGLRRVPIHLFGKRSPFTYATTHDQASGLPLANDMRLFLTTFLGGLLFMTVYLG